jgi:hypothetical protein
MAVLMATGDDTSLRDRIDWSPALAEGLVSRQAMLDAVAASQEPSAPEGT